MDPNLSSSIPEDPNLSSSIPEGVNLSYRSPADESADPAMFCSATPTSLPKPIAGASSVKPPQQQSASVSTQSSFARVSTSACTSGNPSKRAPTRREIPVEEKQRELYCKYLVISSELKELMKQQLQDALCDNELKELHKQKALLEIECSKAILDLKNVEKERVLSEMKQDFEIKELQKEKLKLEIQALKINQGYMMPCNTLCQMQSKNK